MMAWVVLMISGLFEAGWAIALKLSEGFSKLWPSVWFLVLATVSFAGLSWSMRCWTWSDCMSFWNLSTSRPICSANLVNCSWARCLSLLTFCPPEAAAQEE